MNVSTSFIRKIIYVGVSALLWIFFRMYRQKSNWYDLWHMINNFSSFS
jgi:hypothetical protein